MSYSANLPIYAISRSRLQYLSSVLPFFKLQHSCFESLILAIFENKFSSEDQNLICSVKQEEFLMDRVIEFWMNEKLRPLLHMSYQGQTI